MNYLEENSLDPNQFDFINILKVHYDKLNDKNIVILLWDQLTNREQLISHDEKLTEYRLHLPVELDKYLQILESKYVEIPKENLQLLDGSYKKYLITFLFFCSKRNGTVTDKTKLTASTLYLRLTLLPEFGKLFFNKFMYRYQVLTSTDIIRSSDVDMVHKEVLIKLVKQHCLQEECLDHELLAASINLIVTSMIFGGSREMVLSGTASGLTACCMKALHIIILHISNHCLIKIIAQRLFRCIRKRYVDLIPNGELAVDITILFLKGTLPIKGFDRKIEILLDAFGDNWATEELINFKDAIKLLNVFEEDHYKYLLRKMITFTEPKNDKTLLVNVFNLLREILTSPPNFSFSKITVLYSCAARNIMHHILNDENQVISSAIDAFKDINDATASPLHQYIFAEVRINRKLVNMPVETVLLGLSQAGNQSWSTVNMKLFEIFARFVAVTPGLNPAMVQKALNGILKDATAVTFHSSLEVLQMSYLPVSERGEFEVAQLLLHIVHNFAFCTTNKFSSTYINHLFYGMLKPSLVNGKSYSPKYYYYIYLTSDFDYEALFAKCKDLIREQEVQLVIKNLNYAEPCSGILLCCLLKYYPYINVNNLILYIIDNFSNLSCYTTTGYICMGLKRVLENQTVSMLSHPYLNTIKSEIMSGLLQHHFPVQSINPVYSLYETIRNILKLPKNEEELSKLLAFTTEKALRRFYQEDFVNNNIILYLNEICLVLNRSPNEPFLTTLQTCLDDSERTSEIMEHMPNIYVETLTLLCTVVMMNKSKVSVALKYLHQNLNSENIVIKVTTIKLLYSLCREVTHEFDVVIKFAFNEIICGNPCLIKICATILEELIHEDYIKLTAENFFKFVYIIGSNVLKAFMKALLLERFILSNQNDIAKFYLSSIMYINMYSKFLNYPISTTFYEDLVKINLNIDTSTEISEFLFQALSLSKKFNIIVEISSIIEDFLKGQCKVDNAFFKVLLDLIATIKFVKTSILKKPTPKHYHQHIIKLVEKRVIRFDPNGTKEKYYMEFENEIKQCTLALLKLLFFDNEQLASKIHIPLFDTLMHWIDFVKAEIIYHIHEERSRDYDPYFTKLVQYYRKNKHKFNMS